MTCGRSFVKSASETSGAGFFLARWRRGESRMRLKRLTGISWRDALSYADFASFQAIFCSPDNE